MILLIVHILETRRREKELHIPYSHSLHPSIIVYSWLLLPPLLHSPLSLYLSSPLAKDASKTLADTNMYLLLAVNKSVNILFSVLKLLTLSSNLPFVRPPCFTLYFLLVVHKITVNTKGCKESVQHAVMVKKKTTVHLCRIMEDELPFVPSVSLLADLNLHQL